MTATPAPNSLLSKLANAAAWTLLGGTIGLVLGLTATAVVVGVTLYQSFVTGVALDASPFMSTEFVNGELLVRSDQGLVLPSLLSMAAGAAVALVVDIRRALADSGSVRSRR